MQRRLFTAEFKDQAVKLVRQPGSSKAGIARDLDIGANVLVRGCRERESQSMPARSSSSNVLSPPEFERLRRKLAKVKTERDILKKALGYFAADSKLIS